MEIFDINKIKDYTEEDLKIFQSIEEKNIESTEELFKNYLKVPFKDDKKTQQLLDKISSHKSYRDIIKSELRKREQESSYIDQFDWSNILNSNGIWSQSASNGNVTWYQNITKNNIHQKMITVTYYDEYEKQSFQIEVIDDVFKSELGNYYLSSLSNGNISLNNVIDIEENSNLYKWYQGMYQKFNRTQKLNRIDNDDNDDNDDSENNNIK
jgi:hypothetical protein